MKCHHFDHLNLKAVPGASASYAKGCEECVKMGDTWVHLRMCTDCGNVGCCDSSKNRHATKHANREHHPLIRSIEPGESWVWCYVDEIMAGELPE